jgi:hypothetical protein
MARLYTARECREKVKSTSIEIIYTNAVKDGKLIDLFTTLLSQHKEL